MKKEDSPLKILLDAVDVATWAWAVQRHSKRKGQVDWKSALDELVLACQQYQLSSSDLVATIPDEPVVKP